MTYLAVQAWVRPDGVRRIDAQEDRLELRSTVILDADDEVEARRQAIGSLLKRGFVVSSISKVSLIAEGGEDDDESVS